MKFSTVVEQVLELLQRQRRIAYRALKRELDLDDEYIEDLKTELIKAKRLARDEDGIVLVWIGEGAERQSLLLAWEDLHWADPSTLEFLGLLIDQVPTARMYMLLTFR